MVASFISHRVELNLSPGRELSRNANSPAVALANRSGRKPARDSPSTASFSFPSVGSSFTAEADFVSSTSTSTSTSDSSSSLFDSTRPVGFGVVAESNSSLIPLLLANSSVVVVVVVVVVDDDADADEDDEDTEATPAAAAVEASTSMRSAAAAEADAVAPEAEAEATADAAAAAATADRLSPPVLLPDDSSSDLLEDSSSPLPLLLFVFDSLVFASSLPPLTSAPSSPPFASRFSTFLAPAPIVELAMRASKMSETIEGFIVVSWFCICRRPSVLVLTLLAGRVENFTQVDRVSDHWLEAAHRDQGNLR